MGAKLIGSKKGRGEKKVRSRGQAAQAVGHKKEGKGERTKKKEKKWVEARPRPSRSGASENSQP